MITVVVMPCVPVSIVEHAPAASFVASIPSKKRRRRRLEEHVKDAEALAVQHGGVIPNAAWLTKNRYHGLYQRMQQNPEAFAHLKRSHLNPPVSTQEYVSAAEKLARQFGAVPSFVWLRSNGYEGLYRKLIAEPEAFAHLALMKSRPSLEDHKATAERLVKQHGGLPRYKWLKAHGYKRLLYAMQRYPEAFAHLDRVGRVAKHVKTAEALIRQHGKLPRATWLRTNGYRPLYDNMRKYPEAFAHLAL